MTRTAAPNVYDAEPIPEEIALRIFKRNFSTKEGEGRGIGTYSMRLFGEKILGGKVYFTSTAEAGPSVCFELKLKG